jgi:hypothetical protein
VQDQTTTRRRQNDRYFAQKYICIYRQEEEVKKKLTDRADGVYLGERGLRVAESARGEVEEVVPLTLEAVEVAALVPALVRRVDGQRLVLLHVVQPPADVRLHQVPAHEVEQAAARRRQRHPASLMSPTATAPAIEEGRRGGHRARGRR